MSAITAAIIGGVASLGSAAIASNAASKAADQQAEAAREAGALWQPYADAGITGQNKLMEYLGIGGDSDAEGYGQYATAEFTPDQFLAGQDPAYAFRMDEGLKALDQTAAARGGLLSGNALQAAQTYGQGLASQEYQNAFTRYQTERANTLGSYQALQGVGQNAAAQQGSQITAAGNAQAAGTVGSANAWSGAISNFGSGVLDNRMNSSVFGSLGQPVELSVYEQPGHSWVREWLERHRLPVEPSV